MCLKPTTPGSDFLMSFIYHPFLINLEVISIEGNKSLTYKFRHGTDNKQAALNCQAIKPYKLCTSGS